MQLERMLATLKKKIKDDRRHGRIFSKRSQRDATVAIDIYLSATGTKSANLHAGPIPVPHVSMLAELWLENHYIGFYVYGS